MPPFSFILSIHHSEELQLEALREEAELKKMAENVQILKKISDMSKGSSSSMAGGVVDKVLESVGEKADNLKKVCVLCVRVCVWGGGGVDV
jgi:hypothetical protein